MGNIYKADCPCGYESRPLFEGCGMAGYGSCRDLAFCVNCHDIVTIPAASKRKRCPKCSRKVQVLNVDTNESIDKSLSTMTLNCPKCGNLTMKLHDIGLWD